jgi:hypothetical protein
LFYTLNIADQDDNYYDPDPDRFSSQTLVFDTTSGNHTYPTTDAEMNLLIDNTLYSKYMYYSLSGGVYYTWQKNESALNIEYNLSLANAYFDGVWGIHFGTGFITDDVVAHGTYMLLLCNEGFTIFDIALCADILQSGRTVTHRQEMIWCTNDSLVP